MCVNLTPKLAYTYTPTHLTELDEGPDVILAALGLVTIFAYALDTTATRTPMAQFSYCHALLEQHTHFHFLMYSTAARSAPTASRADMI